MLATVDAPLPPTRPAPILAWLPSATAIEALGPRSCRWPQGEVWHDDFRFCGALRSRGAYCAAHGLVSRARVSR